MAKQTINIGASPNDGTGTPLRTSFDYCNQNFTELYTATGPSGNNIVVPGNATITGDLTVRTNKLAVTSAGVGFGTTSPNSSFQATLSGLYGLRIQSADTNNSALNIGNDPASGYAFVDATKNGSGSFLPLRFSTSDNERYRIAIDGVATWSNVGGVAGTAMTLNSTGLGVGASPAEKLTVSGNIGVSGAVNYTGSGEFYLQNTASTNFIGINPTSNYIRFGTNNTVKAIIDSSGNVGVGVTPSAWSSSYKALQMQSLAFTSDANSFYQSNNAFINSTPAWTYIASKYAVRYDQDVAGGNHKWFNAPSGTAGNTISWTQAMTLDASGNLTVANGNVILGTSFKGIDFSATPDGSGTMTSELLNDYEEGTFTPGITFGGASVGMTGTFNGRYTKVGRVVTISGLIALSAKGTSTGTAVLTGLPFASSNGAGSYTAICLRYYNTSFSNAFQGYLGQNTSTVTLEQITTGGTVNVMSDSNFTNSSAMIVNFTYDV